MGYRKIWRYLIIPIAVVVHWIVNHVPSPPSPRSHENAGEGENPFLPRNCRRITAL
ncbi:hypothetical protein JOD20_001934 [Herpetosiphon giganteus]|nr:hypothetical protein [Herpetosiphon giganteus]